MSSHDQFPPMPQQPPPGSPPPGPGPVPPADFSPGAASGPPPGSGPDGVPQPAPAPGYAGTGPTGAQAAPETRRGSRGERKRRLPLILSLCAVGVVLVLVVVGILTVRNVNRSEYGPDVVAQKYMDAVAAGDLDAAQAIAEPQVPNGADTTLLDPEIARAAAESIEEVSVSEPRIDGDSATLTAAYSVDGQSYELPLTATRTGRTGLFFDEWTLNAPVLQTLTLDLVQTDGTTVNDVDVSLQSGATEYAVMPGTYRAAVAETKYTEPAESTISLGFSETPEPQPAPLDVTIHTNKAYAEDVQKAVDTALEKCVDSEKLETDCGFFSRDAFATEDEKEKFDTLKKDGVDFDLKEKPTVTVSSLGLVATGSFYTEDGKRGKVEAVVEAENGDEYQLEADLGPSGTTKIEDDKIVIDFLTNG
jgi:hypothetical protein